MNARWFGSITTVVLALACSSPPYVPPDAAQIDVVHVHDGTLDITHEAARDVTRRVDVTSRCIGDVPLPYPDANTIAVGSPVPDLPLETATSTTSFATRYTPCASRASLVVVRVLAAWSGPSRHAVSHTRRLVEHPSAARFSVVDLLVRSQENQRPSRADLSAWTSRYDTAPSLIALDPEYRFRSLYLTSGTLPLYVLIDARTMTVLRALETPAPDELDYEITAALARLDGIAAPAFTAAPRIDGRFSRDQIEMIAEMALPPSAPPDPTNRVADDARAAALGERLFSDVALSGGRNISCASCHARDRAFTDGMPVGVGEARGDRNTPTVLAAAHTRWLLWDGRADTLWGQSLGPIENPLEMRGTRLAVAHHIARSYATEYTAIFGPLPALDDRTRFPPMGAPGDAAWEAMREADREAVTAVFVNVGKAIAAFERTLRPPMAPIDRYVAGNLGALTDAQKDGLRLFFEAGCIQCHHGPWLTDDSFHNVGMPTGRRDGAPDRGRADAISALMRTPFRSDGSWSDAPVVASHLSALREDPSLVGMFHTPTLRSVARTGPWGHGGTFNTIEEVIRHYASGLSRPPVAGTTGERDLHLPAFHTDMPTLRGLIELMNAFGE